MVIFSPLILLAKLFIGQILVFKNIMVYKFLKITNSHQHWSQKLFKTHLVSQKLIMTHKRKISYLAWSAFWPCGDCRGNCTKNSVCCDSCNSWYHYSCQNLSLDDITFLTCSNVSKFCCSHCLQEEIGPSYSYDAALLRLSVVGF